MAYRITFKKSVAKDLRKIEPAEADKILKKIDTELSEKANQYQELQGQFAGLRKYRIGSYRVVYAIIHEEVMILRIRHRKEVYKN